jgi:hypothetical protein
MLRLRFGDTGAQKGDTDVNAYAILVVNEHIESLRADATKRRLASGPTLRDRITAAAHTLRANLTAPVVSADSVLPTLSDYPYRS